MTPVKETVVPTEKRVKGTKGYKKKAAPPPDASLEAEEPDETEEATEDEVQIVSQPFGPKLSEAEGDVSHTTPDANDKARFEKSRELAEVCHLCASCSCGCSMIFLTRPCAYGHF